MEVRVRPEYTRYYCPKCKTRVSARYILAVGTKCPKCGEELEVKGNDIRHKSHRI